MGNDEVIKIAWNDLCVRLEVGHVAMKWWAIISEKYGQTGRHYHNIRHIKELLVYVDEYREEIEELDTVLLAIFFHDVIYDPKSSSNEDDSAELFRDFVQDCNSSSISSLSNNVIDYIDCTKTHKLKSSDSYSKKLFSDFDMAILGSRRPRYKEYALQIRSEFSHVQLDLYCVRRAAFLRSCATSEDYIYATDVIRNRCEKTARANLLWECSFLDSGVLPDHNDEEIIIKPSIVSWPLLFPVILPLVVLVWMNR